MSDKSFEDQVAELEASFDATKEVEDKIPSESTLKGMSNEEIEALKDSIRAEFSAEIKDTNDRFEALKKSFEMQETLLHVDRKGAKNETAEKIKIRQRGPLGPIDHHGRLAEKYKEQLKGKKARFVTTADETLESLRRGQGYEPIRDEDGNEVRYMDGTLMAMPMRRFEEEVQQPKREKREIHRSQIMKRFKEIGDSEGVETSVKFDYDTH